MRKLILLACLVIAACGSNTPIAPVISNTANDPSIVYPPHKNATTFTIHDDRGPVYSAIIEFTGSRSNEVLLLIGRGSVEYVKELQVWRVTAESDTPLNDIPLIDASGTTHIMAMVHTAYTNGEEFYDFTTVIMRLHADI